MQISRKRQDARIRISKLEITILKALESFEESYTEAELILAVTSIVNNSAERIFKLETPLEEE